MPLLQVSHLCKAFDGKPTLNDVSFGVAAGEDAGSGEGGVDPGGADDFGAGLFAMALGVEVGEDQFASELPTDLGRMIQRTYSRQIQRHLQALVDLLHGCCRNVAERAEDCSLTHGHEDIALHDRGAA